MKLYILLFDWGYDGESLAGVYSSREKAEETIKVMNSNAKLHYRFNIRERELDAPFLIKKKYENMKTEVTVEESPKTIHFNKLEVEIGNYYKDISEYGGENIYQLTRSSGEDGKEEVYFLHNVLSGESYSRYSAKTKEDAFSGDMEDFILVRNITIAYSL